MAPKIRNLLDEVYIGTPVALLSTRSKVEKHLSNTSSIVLPSKFVSYDKWQKESATIWPPIQFKQKLVLEFCHSLLVLTKENRFSRKLKIVLGFYLLLSE